MMGHRLLVVSLMSVSLLLGAVLLLGAPSFAGDQATQLIAKNDKSVSPDPGMASPQKGNALEPDKGLKKGKGPKGGKGKDLDKAAMNQVRNAYKFLDQGKPEKALQELEKARRMAPNNYWVNYYSAGAYHQLKDYARARRYWIAAEGGADTVEQRSRVRTAQAYTEYMVSSVDQARASLKAAVEIDNGNVRARQLLAEIATPARPGEPQAGARIELGDVNSFLAYFKVQMP